MTKAEKEERMARIKEQLLELASIMSKSDAHASKCVKLGLSYKDTYPNEYDEYVKAREDYNKLENDTVLGQLANEMMEFMFTPFTEETRYPDKSLCTNLFEAAVEYCQILKEILFLQNKGVELH